jgi:hypothetical protein
MVGCTVGDKVGFAVGKFVGAAVGTAVGYIVGTGVGIDTHTFAPSSPDVHMPTVQAVHWSYTSESWYFPDGQ